MVKKKRTQIDFDPSIDEDVLDKEWLNQPNLYFTWARRLADAKHAAETAKNRIELARAEADTYIRRHPKTTGMEKPTEKAIEHTIVHDTEYQAAIAAHLDAKRTADIIAAAVAALDHRKRALENLVELKVREYFSEPRGSQEGKAAVEATANKRIRGVRKHSQEED